jgi:uncharacterized membrane protein YphA (DoxX/SURF4 family)
MNERLIFVLKTLLSAAFLYYGLQKLGGFAPAVEMYERLGFGQAPRFMTGSAELLGALGLWWRGRELLGCLVLLGTMAVATFALLVYLGPPYAPVPHLSIGVLILTWHHRDQLRRVFA